MTANNQTMSILSHQQQLQNQLQLKQLQTQEQKQQEQRTKSLNSNKSAELANLVSEKTPQKRKDPRDPLAVQIPTTANPTEILASRFNSWRNVIRALLVYLKDVVSVHEEVVRQQVRLQQSLSFPFTTQGLNGDLYQPITTGKSNSAGSDGAGPADNFAAIQNFFLPLGNGSIYDLPSILLQFHSSYAVNAQKTIRELNSTVIPRLEELRRDLLVKIKEIRGLQSDFKNNVNKEVLTTKQELTAYQSSIELVSKHPNNVQPKNDPYLLRTQLDRQIKRQIQEENFLHEAYLNLQSSAKELEKVIFLEVQSALTVYAKLLGKQAQTIFDVLITKLDNGFLTKEPSFEWDSYISREPNFIDPNLPMRHYRDLVYPHNNSPLSFEIRSGYLERRSKFLKSYSKGWYVLTATFLHEFKTPDRKRDPIPVMSLPLNDCQITEHSKMDTVNPDSWHKFVLHAKQNGIINRGHNWVFRAEGYQEMMKWYNDMKQLIALPTPQARSSIAAQRESQRVQVKQSKRHSKAGSLLSSSTVPSDKGHQHSTQYDQLNTVLSLPQNVPGSEGNQAPYFENSQRNGPQSPRSGAQASGNDYTTYAQQLPNQDAAQVPQGFNYAPEVSALGISTQVDDESGNDRRSLETASNPNLTDPDHIRSTTEDTLNTLTPKVNGLKVDSDKDARPVSTNNILVDDS
ncbi:Phosphoinositide PI4,5P(2) binding protein [Komagataella phaffii CBS 7435]|uniref:Phosphoinositide PI4,5P(2) binding protein, forms a complex with Slm2p n=2 Tax=Komagataella phaffii TaxID=460519 RepID=C4QYE4_KOMPG|nr:Phosphoinositide PI4,5P(2) binding protein, forms a complex with Slm2p [Komagataella phaffii GS115]AOA60582.1 GQ67_01744T0 [Komagataella phaffii]CAH2447090.1 Phosphoinositide PI4,5P(2) binding protein [Komagataella phaffii CBS 7435]AOA65423.1 GQ68_01759T0 [Komagataella phaffii GS115]CAY68267.1 Phosphoinositide PI4,5P(2) binding protein, forms a complex with Slm2p [Komagataella phaffii GS115]SCV11910.1 Phosphoinositide PI4,5P(2) binding protein [Komagataella phaffii CBS 7435]